jgi:dUTP pyrophosphatase
MKLNIKIKKVTSTAQLPTKAHATDAGYDLYASSCHYEDGMLHYGTGVAVEIPAGYVGLVFPRSSIANTHLTLSNSVGVIDSGYRGEIKAKFRKGGSKGYKVGERIAQLIIMPYPEVTFEEVDELSESDRGTGGYGSSGK